MNRRFKAWGFLAFTELVSLWAGIISLDTATAAIYFSALALWVDYLLE